MDGFRKWLLVKDDDVDVLDKENMRVTSANVMRGMLTSLPMQRKQDSQVCGTATQLRL